jgi:hypothetical protein
LRKRKEREEEEEEEEEEDFRAEAERQEEHRILQPMQFCLRVLGFILAHFRIE